jgi:predicted nucleic acid-binding protein
MDYILLDTCIVLHILRKKDYGERAIETIRKYTVSPAFVLSVVTAGELEAMKLIQSWGEKRKATLDAFSRDIIVIDIADPITNC